LEGAGFEIKNIDVLGVHYSATIYRWYKNWVSNREKVIEKYGERWYRVWVFFLAYSTIISRYVVPMSVGIVILIDTDKEVLQFSRSCTKT
jgi:cyclopropane fatty-acyl-phospholipid synthase-like methyltransferase